MPGPAASATNVGASSRSPSKTVAPRTAGTSARQRIHATPKITSYHKPLHSFKGNFKESDEQWGAELGEIHSVSRHRRHVALLHGRLTGTESWSSSCFGDESALHRVCIHAAHLGKVHPLLSLQDPWTRPLD
ncbi:hypothetical protein DNTS_001306 [Danionella cerebrum]|uniref:Uncharacterized protein n=1 Tax=Danionella cerebrum TaxID=2873325 RepID=A0A553Q3R2_9TELE|nr:hypothetical protein DNTS_001306 [Danionella translucida]TRY84556.1 hypothetical protein DNTS_001306 [Danionella translucida]